MNSPRRRPSRARNLGIVGLAKRFADDAAIIEAGWSELLDQLATAGWPTRTPDHDRRPTHSTKHGEDMAVIDYADPVGDSAASVARLHDLRETLEDHRQLVEQSMRALRDLTSPFTEHLHTIAVPNCSTRRCHNTVETDGRGNFRGMERIGPIWRAKPGATPLCARCRKAAERKAADDEAAA